MQTSTTNLRTVLLNMAVGLIPMLFLGILAGVFSQGYGYADDNSFNEFYGLVFYLIPSIIVFSFVGKAVNNPTMFLYPVAVWTIGMFGYGLKNHSLFDFLANAIPGLSTLHRADYVIGIAFWYCAVFLIAHPLYCLYKERETEARTTYGVALIISVIAVTVPLFIGESLYTTQQRERGVIHVPHTKQFTSTEPQSVNDTHQSYFITSPGISRQTEINAFPLKDWSETDTKKNCGSRITSNFFPGQSPRNEYKTTPGGTLYARAVFISNSTNPPRPENEYHVHLYCWVLGYHKYTAEIDNRSKDVDLDAYPIESLIDAIVTSPI